jgi:signal transduction histidine kinase
LYSGLLLNLFTNALKAVIADSTPNRPHVICFKAWNEQKWHILEVLDNGIGIPPSLRNRIWDPLFTTTSNLNNPFGSGMGLGLSLIKKLLSDIGGSIDLVSAPPNFTTCFRVELPFS